MVNTVVSIFEPGTDQELPIGQRGEMCICTPTAMKGYYNKPEETAIPPAPPRRRPAVGAHRRYRLSWTRTASCIWTARIKRIIIRHDGFKVFPSMIENVISRHPAVHQCSVVGCADKDHVQGRLPFVFVVLNPDRHRQKTPDHAGAAPDVRRGAARICPARRPTSSSPKCP